MNKEEDRPPIFKHWSQVYALVLIVHLLLILTFGWFMLSFG